MGARSEKREARSEKREVYAELLFLQDWLTSA